MNHAEIRFQVLKYLYDKHYSDQLGHPQSVLDLIQNSELKDLDQNIVLGDVVYLRDSGYVSSMNSEQIGLAYPPVIIITNFGIDTVDNITNQIIENISDQNQESVKKEEIEKIRDEQDPKERVIKIWNYVKSKPELFINIGEKILRAYLSSGQTIG